MLNSEKKYSALRDKINKYSNSRVFLNETKNHTPPPPPPPLQVKWSVPKLKSSLRKCYGRSP